MFSHLLGFECRNTTDTPLCRKSPQEDVFRHPLHTSERCFQSWGSMLSLRTVSALGWATEVAVGSTTSEVLCNIEWAGEVEEIASCEWDPDNNVRELLGPCRKGILREQKASPVNLRLFLYTLTVQPALCMKHTLFNISSWKEGICFWTLTNSLHHEEGTSSFFWWVNWDTEHLTHGLGQLYPLSKPQQQTGSVKNRA